MVRLPPATTRPQDAEGTSGGSAPPDPLLPSSFCLRRQNGAGQEGPGARTSPRQCPVPTRAGQGIGGSCTGKDQEKQERKLPKPPVEASCSAAFRGWILYFWASHYKEFTSLWVDFGGFSGEVTLAALCFDPSAGLSLVPLWPKGRQEGWDHAGSREQQLPVMPLTQRSPCSTR